MAAADKFVSELQKRFPNVTVKWNPPPHPILETQPCTITFSPKANPEVILEIDMDNGLNSSTAEADVKVLIEAYGKRIDEL